MKSITIRKPRFIILSLKKYILPAFICLFIISLVVFSKDTLIAAKSGLSLWANNVIPSLFPFFIAIEVLSYTDISYRIGYLLSPIMKPLFNISGVGAYPFLMGIISGYPIGAKLTADLRKDKTISKEEAERLISFTNNSGPLFIIGTVGISFFYNFSIGVLLFITHLLGSLTVGFLFRFWKCKNINKNQSKHISNAITNKGKEYEENIGTILKNSVLSSINNILMIGGFIVLFSVIISILQNSNIINILTNVIRPISNMFGTTNEEILPGFISGIVEITTGIFQISTASYKILSTNIIITSFLLGFSGLSVLTQVLSFISNTDISIKPYIIGKILHGIFASIYTYIFINTFTIFNL